MSEQPGFEIIPPKTRIPKAVQALWKLHGGGRSTDGGRGVWNHFYDPEKQCPPCDSFWPRKTTADVVWREASLPATTEHREIIQNQRLQTQLIAALRTAYLAVQQKDEILRQNYALTQSVHRLVSTENVLVSVLGAAKHAQVCLHEHYSGTVSEILGEQIVVVYQADGEPLKQYYDKKQFLPDRLPKEGDTVLAYVYVTRQPLELEGGSADHETRYDFSGFDKKTSGDIEL